MVRGRKRTVPPQSAQFPFNKNNYNLGSEFWKKIKVFDMSLLLGNVLFDMYKKEKTFQYWLKLPLVLCKQLENLFHQKRALPFASLSGFFVYLIICETLHRKSAAKFNTRGSWWRCRWFMRRYVVVGWFFSRLELNTCRGFQHFWNTNKKCSYDDL